MKIEELIKILNDAGVQILNLDTFGRLKEGTCHIERNIHFKVGDTEYYIEWFCNQMTLFTVGNTSQIMFHTIEHSGTWPNHFKRNLQFRYGEHCVGCIGLERYND